jgi:hypothetical protein
MEDIVPEENHFRVHRDKSANPELEPLVDDGVPEDDALEPLVYGYDWRPVALWAITLAFIFAMTWIYH